MVSECAAPTCVCDVSISSLFDPVETAGGCMDDPPPPVAAICTAVRTALIRLPTVLLTSEMLNEITIEWGTLKEAVEQYPAVSFRAR